ncbi:MAG TPA: hypothetical protein PKW82_12505 [Spirochaetales bacterium]|nr:hypothetical protein [Spirochaetales bacterium]
MNKIGGEKALATRARQVPRGLALGRFERALLAARPALAFPALFALVLLGSCVSPSAEPDFHVSGVVLDARTGSGIAGAVVQDSRWSSRDPRGAVSSPDGSFGYFTWYEEHEIVVSAPGYLTAARTLETFVIGRSPVAVIEFELEPVPDRPVRSD